MKIKIDKIKKRTINILRKFWQNLLLVLIALFALDLIIGGILFWKYHLQSKKEKTQLLPTLKINKVLMKKVSTEWEKRKAVSEEIEKKQYSDCFQGPVSKISD